MEKFTQKWTIVSFFRPVDIGYEFSANNWPAHVTLADTFAANFNRDKLRAELEMLSKDLLPITLQVANVDFLGPVDNKVSVMLFVDNHEIRALHERLIAILENYDAAFNNKQFTRAGFIAHSTIGSKKPLPAGSIVNLSNLALVDMFPGANAYQRKVLAVV